MDKKEISEAAAILGRKGGQTKTPARAAASRDNGRKGGRPKNLVKYRVHFYGPEVTFFADSQASYCELYHKAAKKLTGDKTACFCQSSSGIPGHGQIMRPCSTGGLTSIKGWGTGVMTIKKTKGTTK